LLSEFAGRPLNWDSGEIAAVRNVITDLLAEHGIDVYEFYPYLNDDYEDYNQEQEPENETR
jgi:hypothetical protein